MKLWSRQIGVHDQWSTYNEKEKNYYKMFQGRYNFFNRGVRKKVKNESLLQLLCKNYEIGCGSPRNF